MESEIHKRGLDTDCTLHQDKFKTLTVDSTSRDILFFHEVTS